MNNELFFPQLLPLLVKTSLSNLVLALVLITPRVEENVAFHTQLVCLGINNYINYTIVVYYILKYVALALVSKYLLGLDWRMI